MDFSKRKSSKASISIPPTQIPLPRASLNKLPAQLRKPNLGGRGGSHAARTAARATTKRSRAAAAARAGGGQQAASGGKAKEKIGLTSSSLCARFGSARLSLQEIERRAAENAVSTAQSRQKDRAISKLKKIRVPPDYVVGRSCVSQLRGKSVKSRF